MRDLTGIKNTAPRVRRAVEVNQEIKRLLETNFTEEDVRFSFSFVEE